MTEMPVEILLNMSKLSGNEKGLQRATSNEQRATQQMGYFQQNQSGTFYPILGISAHLINQKRLPGSVAMHTIPPFWNLNTGLSVDPVIR